MKISKVHIKNFRNITDVLLPMFGVTVIIGNNNSGKSNFLRAITLPLLSDDLGTGSKNLGWMDIGDKAKKIYYDYIKSNKKDLCAGVIDKDAFIEVIPTVSVVIDFRVDGAEGYAMKDFVVSFSDDENANYQLAYSFSCKKPQELLNHVIGVLRASENENLDDLKLNLLPIDLYSYSIYVPLKDKNLNYDNLRLLKYNSIAAERDDFSTSSSRLGSKPLVQLLNKKLPVSSMMHIEKEYASFFEQIKSLTGMEEILNWQEYSEVTNASEFFSKISILPNMPPMASLLSSVKLGYEESNLALQGLGHRNLILQLVIINSLMEASNALFSLLTVEEPEAHLCYSNQKIMNSFILNVVNKNDDLQLIYSTHSTQFLDKVDLSNIILLNNGEGYAFADEFEVEEMNYLSKTPNLDLFKLFYSRKCILVEGLTEELLIKSYFKTKQNTLSDIEVISFHKGFKKIIDIWLKLNKNTNNKLGIIRDFDNQKNAQLEHEKYNTHRNISIETTIEYTLENDIVAYGNNFDILKEYFHKNYEWENIETREQLSAKWIGGKAEVMLSFCQDMGNDDLKEFELPAHINKVIKFLEEKEEVGVAIED
ncbi:AAA family ATPase [Listeria booriae]|uniref:AAA family ATPase n=3 Tax=Listeria booriae TaxID=1552123 RepID=A0A841YJK6_9LIST|nr:AAA family ATPase [Listeria booriae]MBC1400383.1 AAA family ATPase [Listeria booriae]